ncbi:hypothetical protein ACWEV3_19000 [Saccharopolyspora sp. NPDC003752]
MRLRRMRHPIDVQLYDPQLRADQDERDSMELRTFGVSDHDTPETVDNFRNFNGNRTFDFH